MPPLESFTALRPKLTFRFPSRIWTITRTIIILTVIVTTRAPAKVARWNCRSVTRRLFSPLDLNLAYGHGHGQGDAVFGSNPVRFPFQQVSANTGLFVENVLASTNHVIYFDVVVRAGMVANHPYSQLKFDHIPTLSWFFFSSGVLVFVGFW